MGMASSVVENGGRWDELTIECHAKVIQAENIYYLSDS